MVKSLTKATSSQYFSHSEKRRKKNKFISKSLFRLMCFLFSGLSLSTRRWCLLLYVKTIDSKLVITNLLLDMRDTCFCLFFFFLFLSFFVLVIRFVIAYSVRFIMKRRRKKIWNHVMCSTVYLCIRFYRYLLRMLKNTKCFPSSSIQFTVNASSVLFI